MKKKKTTKSPVPDTVATLGTLGTCLFWGPFGLVAYPILRAAASRRVARDIDNAVEQDAERTASHWRRHNLPDEKGVDVSKTIPFGGLNIPSTRIYSFSDDD